MEQKVPDIIAEWIDQTVLPDLADGHHTAEQIWDEVHEECSNRIEQEKEGVEYRFPEGDQPLIDSWMLILHHKTPFIDCVQSIFDSWEESVSESFLTKRDVYKELKEKYGITTSAMFHGDLDEPLTQEQYDLMIKIMTAPFDDTDDDLEDDL